MLMNVLRSTAVVVVVVVILVTTHTLPLRFPYTSGDLSIASLRYLSSSQALADAARFVTHITRDYGLPPSAKWAGISISLTHSLAHSLLHSVTHPTLMKAH